MPNLDAIGPSRTNNHNHNFIQPAKRRRKWKWLVVILIVLIVALWSGFELLARTNQIFTGKNGNIFTRVSSLLISPDKPLVGEEQGTINVLLMGMGGEGHDGAHLTDTMIVAQINTKTNEVVLVSIPRDFASKFTAIGYNKINAVYAYAYRDNPDSAGSAAMAAAEKITGFTIPYYAVVDFEGFTKAVDDVGGVDITVDDTFTDSSFPNDYPYDTKGYLAPITFTKGQQHMTGQRALIFARSRHSGDAGEGSDFARSERQKKIIVAIKTKVFALNLTNLNTINNLLSDFTENFRTNLEPYEMKRLLDVAKKIDSNNIYSFSLEPQDDLICSALVDPQTGKRVPAPPPVPSTPPADTDTPTPAPTPPAVPEIIRMYVVQPCEPKTLTDIHEFLVNIPLLSKLKKETAVVEIQNSTGQASATAPYKPLVNMGIDVRYVPFKGKVPYNQTIFYDDSHGKKQNTLDYLKSNYSFTTSDVNYPASAADFVIVLGKDAL